MTSWHDLLFEVRSQILVYYITVTSEATLPIPPWKHTRVLKRFVVSIFSFLRNAPDMLDEAIRIVVLMIRELSSLDARLQQEFFTIERRYNFVLVEREGKFFGCYESEYRDISRESSRVSQEFDLLGHSTRILKGHKWVSQEHSGKEIFGGLEGDGWYETKAGRHARTNVRQLKDRGSPCGGQLALQYRRRLLVSKG